jgi:putative transposase
MTSAYGGGEKEAATPPPEQLRAAVEALVLEFPGYGYRRVTRQLQREGWRVNHKRMRRLLGEWGLLKRRKRRFVRTTQSKHGLPIFANLLPEQGWQKATAPNQIWAADLTYIRLGDGFCYLAAILDAFTRRIVGWALSRSLEVEIALEALEMALTSRPPEPGWIHHSDRGSQYASHRYVARLRQAGARISMSGVGEPRENAQAERFMRTLKEEEVDLQEYGTYAEAKQSISRFIDELYNQKRLHSALGYRTPNELEEMFVAN